MNKLLVIAIMFLMFSCKPNNEVTQLQKPLVIIGKYTVKTDEVYYTYYIYEDANGNLTTLYDYVGEYNVGDTLK